MTTNFFDTPQAAALLKHGVLGRYLRVFVQKTGSTSATKRVAYLDGYAGPGEYGDGSAGSPAVAVQTARTVAGAGGGVTPIDGYFIESDPDSAQALKTFIAEKGLHWPVFPGNIEDHLKTVVKMVDPRTPLFAFLDPFGLGIPMDMLREHLMSRGGQFTKGRRVGGAATEVLLNFSMHGLRRNAGHLTSDSRIPSYLQARDQILRRLDKSLGGDWWQTIWLSAVIGREETILAEYLRRLRSLPGNWQTWEVPVSDRWQGKPDYYLVFLTQHPDGMWHFGESLSNALEPYREYCLQGQLDLEPLSVREEEWVAEIKNNLRQLLDQGKPVPVGPRVRDVKGDALTFAREKHIRRAIKALHQEGHTPTTGVGDIKEMIVQPPNQRHML